jgi:hypothetical protein
MPRGLANPSREPGLRSRNIRRHMKLISIILGSPDGILQSPAPVPEWIMGKSYGQQLRGWTASIALRYILAAIFLLAAGASLAAASGVGLAALFRWIEVNYGATLAYAGVAGLLVVLGLIGALTGIVFLKQPLPPIPSARKQVKTAGRTVVTEAMSAASAPHKALVKADPVTEIMIGLAAACLAGWLVSSRLGRSRARSK